jgi:hypothetical protein
MRISRRPVLIGSGLLALSAVALVAISVAPGPKPIEVLRAKINVAEGQSLVLSDFERVSIGAEHQGVYLDSVAPGVVALQSIFQGEFLPRSSVSQSPQLSRVKVTIEPSRLPVTALEPGESVELWAVATRQGVGETASQKPVQLVSPDATILERPAGGTGFAATDNGLDVLVSRVDLPLILEAIASPDTELVLVRNPRA